LHDNDFPAALYAAYMTFWDKYVIFWRTQISGKNTFDDSSSFSLCRFHYITIEYEDYLIKLLNWPYTVRPKGLTIGFEFGYLMTNMANGGCS